MQKTKRYASTRFDSRTIILADKTFRSLASNKVSYSGLDVEFENERWSLNSLEEFLASMEQGNAYFRVVSGDYLRNLTVQEAFRGRTTVSVAAPSREEIETVFKAFDDGAERCRLPDPSEDKDGGPRIFIGHGHSPQWRDLKDHLHEKHGHEVSAYEIGSRAGHTIRDILEEMLEKSSFALLVMTGEDEMKDGKILARQNVIHEAGLFQGRLGFNRAIVLLEEGTDEFSNIHGLQQIRYSKGRIAETYGEVLAVLKREFQ